ncbi:MAG: ABC-F family ATP-binding cassette domain-containing protein [Ruminococcaceae bacterium]|nr:ABC-F family ATP-binding cassette domain-containing protein [Oscillospiraceae bacterium]
MQLKIQNGVVELSGEPILKSVNIEINDQSKIAIVGRNGCGKTTLLKLIAGEYKLAKLDSDNDTFFAVSGKPKIGYLSQITFDDYNKTLLEEVRSAYSEILALKEETESARLLMEQTGNEEDIKNYTNLLDTFTNLGGFYFEREYENAIKKFGFADVKHRPLCEFSGGQQTKIAFLKLLLSKPDILLLDEPTNHLDIEAVEWLEEYLRSYKKAFVVVSHDRMFLDNTVSTVYEIEYGKTYKYNGNYSAFAKNKKILREQQRREYLAYKAEKERLGELVDRFRYKATKAAMAQSKLKQIERMDEVFDPDRENLSTFHTDFEPKDIGVKDVLSVKDLGVGYDSILSTVNLEVKRGDKIGIIGGNGLGKSTFIKTLMGLIPAFSGEFKFGPRVSIGYFDQQLAQYSSSDTVLGDFLREFPALTEFEARSSLGAFVFSGEDVFKTVDVLSGGERVRLALCKIFKRKPNVLVLDEPTNHLDIVGKETLEEILKAFSGTVIFVSHDRYFIKEISTSLLDFKRGQTAFYPFGYDEYLSKAKIPVEVQIKEEKPKEKKTYTTPLKEKARREKALKKAEEKIAKLESEIENLQAEQTDDANLSDYVKLAEIGEKLEKLQQDLETAYSEWEQLAE